MCEIETEREIEGHIISARWLLGLLWLLIVGTLASSAVAQPTEAFDVSSQLRGIATAGQLPELRWPDFSDYRAHVQNFYRPAGYAPAWIHEGRPTPQALEIIEILKQADSLGLDPEDYDGSRWDDRLSRLQNARRRRKRDLRRGAHGLPDALYLRLPHREDQSGTL